MSRAPRQEDGPIDDRTVRSELELIRKVVKWTLWKVATGEVDLTPFDRHTPKEHVPYAYPKIIQAHAEAVFCNPDWSAQVDGQVAAQHYGETNTIEWDAFIAKLENDDE